MRLSVDRIENGTVVCIDDEENTFFIELKRFPYECLEGDVIDVVFRENVPVFIALNEAETQKRRGTLTEMLEKLRKGR